MSVVPIRPIIDLSSQLETVLNRGVTQADAKSSADFRRLDCEHLPKWVQACVRSMVGTRGNLTSSAAVWRLVIKAGCMRLDRQQQLKHLRDRNRASLAHPESNVAMDLGMEKRRYAFVERETYVGNEGSVDTFYREKELMETYSDQLHINLDDIVTIVSVLALSSSPGESNNGVVPDHYLGIAIREFDGFTEWVYNNAYLSP